MDFLSDIIHKGKVYFQSIVEANGSPLKFLLRNTETGEVVEKDITIPSSAGDEDVVNTSDGSGGFKETQLRIDNDKIGNKYAAGTHHDATITIYDDGIIDVNANSLELKSEQATLQNQANEAYNPMYPDSLVTKRYIDEKVSLPWIDLQTINDTEYKNTSQLSLVTGNAYDLKLEVKWKYSVGTTRITGKLKAIASVYHTQVGLVLRTFIGDINVIEFNGVIVTNYDSQLCNVTPMTAGQIIVENKSSSFFNSRELSITNNSGYDMEFMYRLETEKY